MNNYIALLRGINVSGQKKIIMADLRESLTSLNYSNIQTYIQSGNILFQSSESSTDKLAAEIKQHILDRFGFDVPTLVRTPADLAAAIAKNPFNTDGIDLNRCYITFLASPPEAAKVQALLAIDYKPEEIRIVDQVAYLYSPEGFARAKLSNNLVEKKLKVQATSRNQKTTKKLIEMASEK
jgi:uncharacterized protein (DUF1697 family)